ncbi:hypothetical protein CS0771_20840 [Catellatospora sp. IY07-71]|uniref:TolB family protein n=1 Tax=Catellatospora sp. IY07-71 TaxID=2728827 RepID=UPI001BB39BC1|nr:PD40 domain-containing protein [Catellatospora sp. IY07-71]BCJ72540.1 hypothetical protein CS0771_20840 [Catellatospora sp. IY07-71]
MRTRSIRSGAAGAAILTASLALVAACNGKTPAPGTSASPSGQAQPSAASIKAGALLVSDGGEGVTIDGRKVALPGPVRDAVWSPDGSRIAFVLGDGVVATARPDGSDVLRLTEGKAGVKASGPAWTDHGTTITFTERVGSGRAKLVEVPARAPGKQLDSGATEGAGNSALSVSAVDSGAADVAYQHQGASGPEVWIADLNQRDPSPMKLVAGSDPAPSPDGERVAFIGKNGQLSVIAAKYGAKPVQVTFGAAKPTDPVWTPDGRSIAYRTDGGIESVAASVKAGAKENPATKLSDIAGVPSLLGAPADRVVRIKGTDPVGTAIAASHARWATQSRQFMMCECPALAFSAVLVAADDADAAPVAAALANRNPVLFTGGATLDARTEQELARLFGKVGKGMGNPTVRLVGDASKIPAAIEQRLKKLNYLVERVTGDRFALAAKAASEYPGRILLVSAADRASVTAASTIADSDDAVLLTDRGTMPEATAAYLTHQQSQGLDTEVYTIGADAAKALAAMPGRKPKPTAAVVGDSDAATAVLVAQRFVTQAHEVVLVDAAAGPDAVVASTLGGWNTAVLVIDPKAGPAETVRALLDASASGISTVWVVDTAGAVSDETAGRYGTLISGPLGFTTADNAKLAG